MFKPPNKTRSSLTSTDQNMLFVTGGWITVSEYCFTSLSAQSSDHANIATGGNPNSGLCPTLIEWLQGFFLVHSRPIMDGILHDKHLNSLEHCMNKTGDESFSVTAPKLWNSFPCENKTSKEAQSFMNKIEKIVWPIIFLRPNPKKMWTARGILLNTWETAVAHGMSAENSNKYFTNIVSDLTKNFTEKVSLHWSLPDS